MSLREERRLQTPRCKQPLSTENCLTLFAEVVLRIGVPFSNALSYLQNRVTLKTPAAEGPLVPTMMEALGPGQQNDPLSSLPAPGEATAALDLDSCVASTVEVTTPAPLL